MHSFTAVNETRDTNLEYKLGDIRVIIVCHKHLLCVSDTVEITRVTVTIRHVCACSRTILICQLS